VTWQQVTWQQVTWPQAFEILFEIPGHGKPIHLDCVIFTLR